jgi:transketolase
MAMTMINHLADARSVEPYGYDDLFRFMSMMTGDEKHSEAATSTLDVIWTLYDRVLHVDPLDLDHPNRDRFYLSKGHGPMAFYAVLAAKGFLDPALLPEFATSTSILGHHPDRRRVPGVEISSGSLGQGLALGVGASLGIGLSQRAGRVFVLVGDGELDEGSNHEAIAFAGRSGIGRLTAIVVDNDSAYHGWPGGIAARFAVEGWDTAVVDGRDHDAMSDAFTVTHPDRPLVVVARVGRKT